MNGRGSCSETLGSSCPFGPGASGRQAPLSSIQGHAHVPGSLAQRTPTASQGWGIGVLVFILRVFSGLGTRAELEELEIGDEDASGRARFRDDAPKLREVLSLQFAQPLAVLR